MPFIRLYACQAVRNDTKLMEIFETLEGATFPLTADQVEAGNCMGYLRELFALSRQLPFETR